MGLTWSSRKKPTEASDSREAILASARRLFVRDGYLVPMSQVAHDAGVGTAELYRLFSTRLDLGLAVFGENLTRLEELASQTEAPEAFPVLWTALMDLTVDSTALMEMMLSEPDLPTDLEGGRLEDLLAAPLASAQQADLADPAWTPTDLKLIVHMIFGVVSAASGCKRSAADRALTLIDPRLAWSGGSLQGEGLAPAV